MGGVIAGLLSRAEAALNYEPLDRPLYRAHAGLKLAALVVSWVAVLSQWEPLPLAVALSYPALLAFLAGRRIVPGAQVALLPALFVGVASLIISPYRYLTPEWAWRSIALALRVYGVSLATLATFITTHPLSLAALVARAPFLHDFIIVYYRTVPMTVQDLEWAVSVQRLHGAGVREALVASTLVSLERARRLELSLAARGMDRSGRRSRVWSPGDPGVGLALLGASIGVLVLAALV